MSLYDAIRPLAFMLEPELAHNLGMQAIERGWVTSRRFEHPILEQRLFGQRFSNPIGLAAGFDKNGVAVKAWHRFGFGFVEIGTVTARPQSGNPKPRLFRFPEDQAIVNRMGFNNDGCVAVGDRLVGLDARIPLGINIGKSKVTPIERALDDYLESFTQLAPFGNYFVVNVSSPNTPGLRALQERTPLTSILLALRGYAPGKPSFVKIAPDLEEQALGEVLEVALEVGITGIIATNTTITRDGLSRPFDGPGGLSGAPLKAKAEATLRFLAQRAPSHLTLIGVGGIFTADDVYERIRAGAHLVQMYTGWVYGGPELVPDVLEDLVGRMEREGIRSLEELRRG